jgi:hypothetical protein
MSDVESTHQAESNDELWHVQLPSGQECRMTLDLLDDAFQDGLIHEDTLIRQDGTTEWVTLREVAGLDSAAGGETAIPPTTATNVAAANSPVSAQHGAFVAPAPAPAPPLAQPLSYAPPPEPLSRSTAPVASDIGSDFGADLDLDAMEFRARNRRSPAKWIIGIAAALGGLGFAVMGASSTADTSTPVTAAAISPVPAPYVPPTPTPPAPEATNAKTEPARALSDDTKRALAAADKSRSGKVQQRRETKGGGGAPAPRRKSDPFHKGGDKYDPLNSSL